LGSFFRSEKLQTIDYRLPLLLDVCEPPLEELLLFEPPPFEPLLIPDPLFEPPLIPEPLFDPPLIELLPLECDPDLLELFPLFILFVAIMFTPLWLVNLLTRSHEYLCAFSMWSKVTPLT
jgi:hypothetical protein